MQRRKELAPELQVELAAEAGNAVEDRARLLLQVLLAVEPDRAHVRFDRVPAHVRPRSYPAVAPATVRQ
jgi:hypothetical protein